MTAQTQPPDYYSLLGISEDASYNEVRQAFRRRAKQFHPDLNRSPGATQAFLVLNEAYYVLRDEERRQTFDDVRDGFYDQAAADSEQRNRDLRGDDLQGDDLEDDDELRAHDLDDDELDDDEPHGRSHIGGMRFHQAVAVTRQSASRSWGAGIAIVGVIGAAVMAFAYVGPVGRISLFDPVGDTTFAVASASPPSVSPVLLEDKSTVASDDPSLSRVQPQPAVKAAQAAVPTATPRADLQATAPAAQTPDELAVLAEAPPPRSVAPAAAKVVRPVAAVHPTSLVRLTAARQVKAPFAATRAAAYLPRARMTVSQRTWIASAAATARASRIWMSKKRQHLVRRAVKRRYASY